REAKRVANFKEWQKHLEDKKTEFINNLKDKKAGTLGADKIAWKDSGHAPEGWQVLNSPVVWYDPYKDHTKFVGRREVKVPITAADPLWTDDYSHILSCVRWHFPWE